MLENLIIPITLFFYISLNSGESHFDRQEIDDDIRIGYGLAIGDVDGDGLPDILLADKKEFVWYRNPDWKRFVMISNLTERDNVCIAARDINGDGMVEVAVGAQWNPGETSNVKESGSVHYLIRPDDPTKTWKPVQLHHEPTVHRMHWIKTGDQYQLVVLPLHGRGNVNGEGAGVKIYAYEKPDNPESEWPITLLDESLHMTHNFDIIDENGKEALLVGGKEGAIVIRSNNGKWQSPEWIIQDYGFGEIRKMDNMTAGIQPMHGHMVAMYKENGTRVLLTDSFKQGHALAIDDLLNINNQQIVAGWREPNDEHEMGIKIFIPQDRSLNQWKPEWIDKNGIACEDLKVADLDGDSRKDIIASGRSTHNLVIYWNK